MAPAHAQSVSNYNLHPQPAHPAANSSLGSIALLDAHYPRHKCYQTPEVAISGLPTCTNPHGLSPINQFILDNSRGRRSGASSRNVLAVSVPSRRPSNCIERDTAHRHMQGNGAQPLQRYRTAHMRELTPTHLANPACQSQPASSLSVRVPGRPTTQNSRGRQVRSWIQGDRRRAGRCIRTPVVPLPNMRHAEDTCESREMTYQGQRT
jgi:hypothetical protein